MATQSPVQNKAATGCQAANFVALLPDEITVEILKRCTTCSRLRLATVCRKLSNLLAHPPQGSEMWGTITVRDKGAVDADSLMRLVPWLLQRAPGIRAVALAVQPREGHHDEPDDLHDALFTLAGALQGSSVKLELRHPVTPGVSTGEDILLLKSAYWTPEGHQALADRLTVWEGRWLLVDMPGNLQHLCSLSSLQEARLSIEGPFQEDDLSGQWVPPAPGLSSLRRLAIIETNAAHAAAILSAAGAGLTTHELCDVNVNTHVREAIAKLSGLRRLAMSGCGAGAIAVDCRALKALAELEVDYSETNEEDLDGVDFTFLHSVPTLRKLTLHWVDGSNSSLLEALLALPQLRLLRLTNVVNWQSAATRVGRLRAQLAVSCPACHVTISIADARH